jgi:5-methyltetrahydropteroyltriglutamate--homocysteine methyltransferase
LDGLRKAEDRAILDVLELQRQVGLDVFTDGEYRRSSWLSNMADTAEGFVDERAILEWRGPGGRAEEAAVKAVGGKLRQIRRLTAHEVEFLKRHAAGRFKMTLPSPSGFVISSYKPGITDRYYPTRSDLLQDLVPIVRNEIKALCDDAVPYIQLDAPQYTFYVDQKMRERLRQSGVDPDKAVGEAVAADNACVQGVRREEVALAMHICRGNNQSRWYTEGGYDAIAEKLFGTLQVDTFLLEYDSERAGGFEPLRFVPKGKTVVLGLITTKEPRLESQAELLRRIEEAAKYVPIENLALSPQCGFASVAAGNRLSPDDQRRKLELVVDTARKVWR